MTALPSTPSALDVGDSEHPPAPAAPQRNRGDLVYKTTLTALALTLPLLLLTVGAELTWQAWPSIKRFGWHFVTESTWDPVRETYGAAPMIFGTLVSSTLALIIGVPLALGVAIYLTEFAPARLQRPVAFIVELLAAVPSVVYGVWGIYVLIPFLRQFVVPPLRDLFGWSPLFAGAFYGNSMLAGGIILAIMVVPYIAAVSREVLLAVPAAQREAALGLGATRWEAVWHAVVPYGRAGILGAVMLGLGRALGETMAVTMVIGNRHDISLSLLQPGFTMAAALASEFSEATTAMYSSALFEVGLLLFVITVLVNAVARLLVWRVAKGAAAGSKAV